MLSPEATQLLKDALDPQGMSLDRLYNEAQAVVLFGSRGAGCAGSASDWDLLCIGTGRSEKRSNLDLVWVPPQTIDTLKWLGGDLAGHVAAYGVWLKGEPRWGLGDVDFSRAARRKEERIARCLRALAQAWSLLGPPYQRKHATLLRRDLQRWLLLEHGRPVPPSAALDERWVSENLGAWFLEALRSLGAEPRLATELFDAASGARPRARLSSLTAK